MLEFEEIVTEFRDPNDNIENYHENLKKIKNNFSSIKKELAKKLNNMENSINEIQNRFIIERNKIKLEAIRDESTEILENLKLKSDSIINEIIEKAKKKYLNSVEIPELHASNTFVKLLDLVNTNFCNAIINEKKVIYNGVEEIQKSIDIEEKTSLDLLIIMDTTGSMDPYLTLVKQNLINIINQIIIECPGIDLNIGFIGYKDVDHNVDYVDLDFTQNYEELKNTITNVQTTLGIDDPEDVEGAMEMALTKNWKNNARFAILAGDYPCHGLKYHSSGLSENFPNGISYRKNIEESIKELAEKNVSLLCMKITEHTDIMFGIFNNIYDNYNNCKFRVVPLQSDNIFADVVVNNSVEIYVSQRNIPN